MPRNGVDWCQNGDMERVFLNEVLSKIMSFKDLRNVIDVWTRKLSSLSFLWQQPVADFNMNVNLVNQRPKNTAHIPYLSG